MEHGLSAELITALGVTDEEQSCATLICKNCTVTGIQAGVSLVIIEGECNGSISTKGVVVVLDSGRVTGSIKARAASIAGKVSQTQGEGSIDIDETLVLLATAEVKCDITASALDTSIGALILGQVKLQKRDATGVQEALSAPNNETANEATSIPATTPRIPSALLITGGFGAQTH